MPLLVEFLLLDEDLSSVADGHCSRIPTSKGIFAEIERQLEDPNSHLRRKSAFGALVTRGASVRALGHEQLEGLQDSGVVRPVCAETLGISSLATLARDASKSCSEAAVGAETLSAVDPRAGEFGEQGRSGESGYIGIATVPKILDFPKPPSRPTVMPSASLGFMRSLFSWIPSCTPVPCSGMPKQVVDSCTILIPEPEALGPCAPLPMAGHASTAVAAHEAGLGGWPLCIPHAYAAFPVPQVQSANAGTGEADFIAPSASSSARGVVTAGAHFHRAAVELDDFELSVIFVPQRCQPVASVTGAQVVASSAHAVAGASGKPDSCRPEPTQSTRASTAADASRSSETTDVWPPPWVQHNRLVLSREGISSFQVWPVTGNGRCAQAEKLLFSDSSWPWPHLVEVTGIPRGAPQAISIVLALPSSALASRIVDALGRVRRKKSSRVTTGSGTARGATRCELHINAKLNLDMGINSVNCAAVVRRGISEACHVGADRVRICSVRDGAGSDGRLRSNGGAESARPDSRPRSASEPVAFQASMAQLRSSDGFIAVDAAVLPLVAGKGTQGGADSNTVADVAIVAVDADAGAADAMSADEAHHTEGFRRAAASKECIGNGNICLEPERGAQSGAGGSITQQLPQQPEIAACAILTQP